MTVLLARDWENLQEAIFHMAVSIKSNIGEKKIYFALGLLKKNGREGLNFHLWWALWQIGTGRYNEHSYSSNILLIQKHVIGVPHHYETILKKHDL